MILVPFWLGVIAGGFVWQDIPFFMGWVLLYLATYPILLLFKKKKLAYYSKWALIYMIPALLLLLFPLVENSSIIYFGLLMLPFFVINAYFSSQNRDRALMNDLSAILAFSIASFASSFLGNGTIMPNSLLVFFTSILFFVGCTFYVKTMIREKNNPQYKWISWTFHGLLPFVWFILGYWLVGLAFVPSLIRAIGFYGKPLSSKQIGIYEIINATLFFIMMTIQLTIN